MKWNNKRYQHPRAQTWPKSLIKSVKTNGLCNHLTMKLNSMDAPNKKCTNQKGNRLPVDYCRKNLRKGQANRTAHKERIVELTHLEEEKLRIFGAASKTFTKDALLSAVGT